MENHLEPNQGLKSPLLALQEPSQPNFANPIALMISLTKAFLLKTKLVQTVR